MQNPEIENSGGNNQITNQSSELNRKFEIAAKLFQENKSSLDEISILIGLPREEIEKHLNQSQALKKEKLLICGGAGFIGSNFVHHILDKYPQYEVINYDKLTYAGNLENLRNIENNPRYQFIEGAIEDYNQLKELFSNNQIKGMINFAAESAVGRSVHGKASDFVYTNVIGVHNLLELVKEFKIPRYVQISTDEVYGTTRVDEDRFFNEESPLEPNVPYSAAKAGGDLLCRAYYNTYDVPVIRTHCSNNYGPYQHPEKVIPLFIYRASNNQTLPLHGNGDHIRDWIFVLDHCEAIDKIFHQGRLGQVYNVGADNEMPMTEIARMILKILGKPESLITYVPDRPGNDMRYAIDASKIHKEVGWQPRHTFEQAMTKTIQWYQNNLDWAEKIQQRDREFNRYI